MKFGVCKDIKELKKFDSSVVDYCEISLSALSKMTDKDIEERIVISRETNIPTPCANGFFPKDFSLCGPDMNEIKIREYTENVLEKAHRMGVKIAVLGSGKARYIEDGWDKELCLKQFESVCGIAGDVAKKYGMTVVVEPLEKGETNSVNSVKEGAEIVRRLNHPDVKLLCDVFHFETEKEPIENITNNADILKHFHIANPDGRLFPKSTDKYDYTKVVKAMKEIGYDASISIEGKALDFDNDLIESIKFLKQIFA